MKKTAEDIQVIYCIVSKIDGKKYIGSAINFRIRKVRHLSELRCKRHHSKYLQNSFDKYGEDNFYFEILEEVLEKEKLIETEQKWIDILKPEYNMNLIAGLNSHLGKKMSDEQKQKISEALKGKPKSKEHIEKMKKSLTGRKVDGTNMNKDKIGKPLSEEQKRKISDGNKGKIVTEEQRKKISETLKKKNLVSAVSITIEKYDLNGVFIERYVSIANAEMNNGFGKGTLLYHLHKKNNEPYKNFMWKQIK